MGRSRFGFEPHAARFGRIYGNGGLAHFLTLPTNDARTLSWASFIAEPKEAEGSLERRSVSDDIRGKALRQTPRVARMQTGGLGVCRA
jgi:hypothetical protein